jgi:preprotein translocase subunit SecE
MEDNSNKAIETDSEAAADESQSTASSDAMENESFRGNSPQGLGLARWVQYVFVVLAAFMFWFFDKVTMILWGLYAEPNSMVSSVGSALVAGFIALRLFKHDQSHRVATEIVAELAKVTWPSRRETYASSIVVIITSLIAAVIIGAFDFVWSAITDLLYKYKV